MAPDALTKERSAPFGVRGDLFGAQLDDIVGDELGIDADQLALHGGTDVELELAVADRAADAGFRLQLEQVFDLEVADHGTVDDGVAAAHAALDLALFRQHEQGRRLAVVAAPDDVALDPAVDPHAAGEDDIAGDLDAVGDQARQLGHLDRRVLALREHGGSAFS